MIYLHFISIVALILFLVVGILIPIHDRIKSFTWIYHEKRNDYFKKAQWIYRFILLLSFVGGVSIAIKPILHKYQIIAGYKLESALLVVLVNAMMIFATLVLGAFIGSRLTKVLKTK